jgi:hypothetical protein
MYIAEYDGIYISCHRKREEALKSLMEYDGFTKKQIREAIKNGDDITVTDEYCHIHETVR